MFVISDIACHNWKPYRRAYFCGCSYVQSSKALGNLHDHDCRPCSHTGPRICISEPESDDVCMYTFVPSRSFRMTQSFTPGHGRFPEKRQEQKINTNSSISKTQLIRTDPVRAAISPHHAQLVVLLLPASRLAADEPLLPASTDVPEATRVAAAVATSACPSRLLHGGI